MLQRTSLPMQWERSDSEGGEPRRKVRHKRETDRTKEKASGREKNPSRSRTRKKKKGLITWSQIGLPIRGFDKFESAASLVCPLRRRDHYQFKC